MDGFKFTMAQAGRLAAAAGMAATLAGCGWTSRDEYLDRHQGSIPPQRGDGSRLTSRANEDPFRAQSGKVAAHPPDGLDR